MKTVKANKRMTALFLSVLMLFGALASSLGFGITKAYASKDSYNPSETYYEIEFVDNTSEEKFTGSYYATGAKYGEPIEFLFRLNKNFKEADQTLIDSYNYRFTKVDMDKFSNHQLDDLKFITKKKYPYYEAPNIETLQMISITSKSILTDYYIGDISERKEIKIHNGKESGVIVLSAPILKLNRNIDKTIVDYEGELNEETKNELISKVKEANPNINSAKGIYVSGDKLIIETWNRFYTGTPFLEFSVEDLVTRVAHSETQTKFEIKVVYQYKDGSSYKEFTVLHDKGEVIDVSDLEMLPDNMEFTDDFMFYEVKGDGTDLITRTVKKITSDTGTQTEDKKDGKDASTQTDLRLKDLERLEKESKELRDRLDSLYKDLNDKDKLDSKQRKLIQNLEDEIKRLEKKLSEEKAKPNTADNKDIEKKVLELEKSVKELLEKLKETEKTKLNTVSTNLGTNALNPKPFTAFPESNLGSIKTGSKVKADESQNNADHLRNKKEKEVRYPNKLTAKAPANSSTNSTSSDSSNKELNTNKGYASEPSKARGTVIENVDNGNGDYPIHHSNETEGVNEYSADARQFVSFTTKSGKTFYLIINHDEKQENVMLLTEVSEDDLLNMVEIKEKPQAVTKEEPVKEEAPKAEEPKKQEEKSDLGTYIILILAIAGVLGAGYYFKVYKKKEEEELLNLEEEDDYYSEAEETQDNSGEDITKSSKESEDDELL